MVAYLSSFYGTEHYGEDQKLSRFRVYQTALEAAMIIFELMKRFPPEEKYSMTDQIRRSSRSV
jgi:hypothetical protein